MITQEQVEAAARKFSDQYLKHPYTETPITMVGWTFIKIVARDLAWPFKKRNYIYGEVPKKTDNLEEMCVIVGLDEKPPESMNLPHEIDGVKIFYQKMGKFQPYGQEKAGDRK